VGEAERLLTHTASNKNKSEGWPPEREEKCREALRDQAASDQLSQEFSESNFIAALGFEFDKAVVELNSTLHMRDNVALTCITERKNTAAQFRGCRT